MPGEGDEPTERPFITVVIPVFNGDRFLAEAIESVYAQTWQDWELVFVDDGSTDTSAAIISRCVVDDPARVRVLEHPNRANLGTAASRNTGVEAARGEWIAFLDQDDVWSTPEKLEEQVAHVTSFPDVDLVYGCVTVWSSWDPTATETDWLLDDYGVDSPTVVPPPGLAREWFAVHNTPCPSTVLLRRSTCLRLGGFNAAFRGPYEDDTFSVKAALHVPILVVPSIWARWRSHSGSSTATSVASNSFLDASRQFAAWALEYVRTEGLDDEEIVSAIRRGLYASNLFDAAAQRARTTDAVGEP